MFPLSRSFAAGLIGFLLVMQSGCGNVSSPAKAVAPAAVQELDSKRLPVTTATAPAQPALPQVRQEFRAAWVATVANLDWPSRPGLPSNQQQAEVRTILDRAVALNLNAIVLQVRPTADAIYPSALEPWSAYLTGKQGQPPQPEYDPLTFWISEAHARSLELHAWFNPYRAWHRQINMPLSDQHVVRNQAGWVRQYGDYLWLDPGEPAASERALAVMADVLRRYDIDGIQIDDYFYPYPIPAAGKAGKRGAVQDFPDQATWSRYQASGGKLSRADWRRDNVNRLVEATHHLVRKEKPWVKFGISPFGIGRPDLRPNGIVGFSQYDQLYADAELWLAQGWVDYLAPQLYWPVNQPRQAFSVLLASWQRANPLGRHIWPGLNVSRLDGSPTGWSANEINRQIEASRQPAGQSGQLHFSMRTLLQNQQAIGAALLEQSYAEPALLPSYPWWGNRRPAMPGLHALGNAQLQVDASRSEPARLAVWKQYKHGWQLGIQAASKNTIGLAAHPQWGEVLAVAVKVQDRAGLLSDAAVWQVRSSPGPA
ncbi:glycoside hydrolase family 10 protein [Chitinimonas sp. PSY-7]|uniref:family 10 glycosylhydrolase n=1 Tax=Chitinimonas sp. PSY-7 TaxID=3459088 RepID=UPI00404014D4